MASDGLWQRLLECSSLPPGEMVGLEAGNTLLAIYNVNGIFYATMNVCTHAFALLTDGWLDGQIVECPLHGGRFDITSGAALGEPVDCDLETFPTRVVDGFLEVRLPSSPA